jgi:hypothetical protein
VPFFVLRSPFVVLSFDVRRATCSATVILGVTPKCRSKAATNAEWLRYPTAGETLSSGSLCLIIRS